MKIFKYICIIGLLFTISSCDDDLLIENPKAFSSPDASYLTPVDIESALNYLYNRMRTNNSGKYTEYSYLHYGTDIGVYSRNTTGFLNDYPTTMLPTSGYVRVFWENYYQMIFNANVVLSRIDGITYPSESDKAIHIAEAKFFRGYAYRCLVHLYGGVPILEEETTSPKRDFVRATKEATLAFAIKDLEEAAAALPGIGAVLDGKASNAAANHLLAELYLAVNDPDKAIAAATTVINDPNIALMTNRFGSRMNDSGNVFWDLHQKDNQNRSSGNTEGIFVLQTDNGTVGGGAESNYNYNFRDALSFERNYGPVYWVIKTPAPEAINVGFGPSTQNGGRPVAFVVATHHLAEDVWSTNGVYDPDDRNSPENIKREFVVDNPASTWFGQSTADFPQSWKDALTQSDTLIFYHPYITKVTTVNDHPDVILANPETGGLNGNGGITYHDWYLMRVAETYLLRAEAYLAKSNMQAAADDINEVRGRSNALLVAPGDVDIDYILDERMRELNWEEPRRMTLSRLGLLVDRTERYNPFSGANIQAKHSLFPIPFSEIERNTQAVLDQNPGYE